MARYQYRFPRGVYLKITVFYGKRGLEHAPISNPQAEIAHDQHKDNTGKERNIRTYRYTHPSAAWRQLDRQSASPNMSSPPRRTQLHAVESALVRIPHFLPNACFQSSLNRRRDRVDSADWLLALLNEGTKVWMRFHHRHAQKSFVLERRSSDGSTPNWVKLFVLRDSG